MHTLPGDGEDIDTLEEPIRLDDSFPSTSVEFKMLLAF